MKRFWQAADGVFRGLLVLEMAIVVLHFLGLGWPGRFALLDLEGGDSLPSWISFLQLVLIGTIFILSTRFAEDADDEPSAVFLLFSGLFFLFLSLRQTTLPTTLKAADLLQGLPVALFIGVLAFRAGRRSFTAMWTRFHRESVIILAGLWLHLFGSVGVEILQVYFLRNGSVLTAGKAFFEMSGGTVILYGLLLFRRERDRWISRFAVA